MRGGSCSTLSDVITFLWGLFVQYDTVSTGYRKIMELDKIIVEEIQSYEADDPREISTYLKRNFGTFVPPTVIAKVRATPERRKAIQEAKDVAASRLGEQMSLIDTIGEDLLSWFANESLDAKTRLEAVKELRQWTKLGIDVSGIHDEEEDAVWVIQSDWSMVPDET
jgi:hypothetical protein